MSTPRGRFQIHLLTAIVLMFAAGGLIKLNMGQDTTVVYNLYSAGRKSGLIDITERLYGWPFLAHSMEGRIEIQYDSQSSDTCATWEYVPLNPDIDVSWLWLAVDAFIAVFILIATAVSCEWLLRRKPRRA